MSEKRVAWPTGFTRDASEASGGAFSLGVDRRALAKDLILVFVFALGLRFLWLALIPPWLSPDEPSHFTYVAHLVEQNEIPRGVEKSPYPDYPLEVSHSFDLTLYRRISLKGGRTRPELRYLPVGYNYGKAVAYQAPRSERKSAAGARATFYPPFYYQFVSAGYRLFEDAPLLSRLYAARGLSAVLGALSCLFGYLFALELCRARNAALAVGLSMALLPMHVFMTASLNNDAGLFLCATGLCWALARGAAIDRFTWREASWLGATSGLTMLMKPTASLLIAFAGLLTVWRAASLSRPKTLTDHSASSGPRDGRDDSEPSTDRVGRFQTVVQLVASFAVPVLLTYGLWIAYRVLFLGSDGGPNAYSQESHLADSVSHVRHGFGEYLRDRYALGLDHFKRIFVRELWGDFGLREVRMGHRPYLLIMILYALSLVGLVRSARRSHQLRRAISWSFALFAAQLLFVFVIADYALFFASTGVSMGIQGRYFLPVAAPLLLLLFLGVNGLRGRAGLPWQTLPVFVGLVQITALRTILEAWYGVRVGL